MGKEQPIKLYFLITFLLIIIMVYFGLMLKNFLSEKLPNKDTVEKEDAIEETLPQEIQQSRAIFSLAVVIFVTLAVIFVMLKIASKNK